jgi:hypothetical protein
MASNGIGDLGQYDFMNKGMYPGSQIDRSYYATPTQVPLGAQAAMADYDPAVNPLTGQPVSRFADGGIARFAQGGSPFDNDPNNFAADLTKAYTTLFGRAPSEQELRTNVEALNKDPDAYAFIVRQLADSPEVDKAMEEGRVDLAPKLIRSGEENVEMEMPGKDAAVTDLLSGYGKFTPKPEVGGIQGFANKVGPYAPFIAAAAAIAGPALFAELAAESAIAGGTTAAGTTAAGTTAAGTGLGTGLAGGTAAGTGITAGGTGIGMTGAATGGIGITGTAASTTPAWMVAAGKGAMTGAAMGGGSAALTGRDVVKGTLYGGVTGAVGGAAGSAMGGGYAGNMGGGALAGATGSALRGGDIATGAGMGAVGGAINTGIGGLDASPEVKTGLGMFGKPLAMSTIAGAMGGGQSNQGGNYNPNASPYGITGGQGGQYIPFNSGIAPIPPSYNPTNPNPFAISGMMPNNLYYGYKPATFGYDNYGSRGYAQGGIAALGSYSDGGRLLKGPGDGMSDDIPASIGDAQPARLADGEFVIPADVVSHLGNGSTDAGAKHLYKMMEKIRHARTGNKKQGKQINPNKFLPKE